MRVSCSFGLWYVILLEDLGVNGVNNGFLSLTLWSFHGLELGLKFWFVIDSIGRLIISDRFFCGFLFLPGELRG